MKSFDSRLAFLTLVVSLFIAPPVFAEERFQMAYISDSPSSSVPYWVAKEAGIFKKYGLDLDLIFINGSTRGIQSLIAGDLDFTGAVGTSAINGKLAGGDIFIIDSLVNTLPYYVVGKPDIKSPEDLKGRSAATHIPGTSADFALRLALRRFGIDYKSIKAVTVGGTSARIAAVMTGQLDFTIVTEPGKIRGEKAGLKTILDMGKLNIPFQFTCTVTTGRMIREHPDKVLRMAKAMAESVYYYKTHREEVIRIMGKYTRGQKRSVLEGAYKAYDELYVEDTHPTLEGLQNSLEVQAEFDPKAVGAKAEDFVDLRFVEELKKTGFVDKLYGKDRMGKK